VATRFKGLLSFLKGSTYCFRAAGSAAWTYGYLLCGTVGVAIVMNTILYVAANSFDMLLATILFGGAALFILIHFIILL
jgi:hypothetical protein